VGGVTAPDEKGVFNQSMTGVFVDQYVQGRKKKKEGQKVKGGRQVHGVREGLALESWWGHALLGRIHDLKARDKKKGGGKERKKNARRREDPKKRPNKAEGPRGRQQTGKVKQRWEGGKKGVWSGWVVNQAPLQAGPSTG